MYKYPRLYLIAIDRGCSLVHVGRWNNGRWEWKQGWRRNLFVREEENFVVQLLLLLDNNTSAEM